MLSRDCDLDDHVLTEHTFKLQTDVVIEVFSPDIGCSRILPVFRSHGSSKISCRILPPGGKPISGAAAIQSSILVVPKKYEMTPNRDRVNATPIAKRYAIQLEYSESHCGVPEMVVS